jgi:peptidoglycan DL-endopeptidase CwlO
VLGRRESRPALALVAVCAFFVAALPAGAGAGATDQADALRGQQSSLAGRSRAAVLSLYSLDTELARSRAALASLRARAAAVERRRADAATEIGVARGVLVESQAQLAARLRTLYEEGEPDAISVLLGATSLQNAVSRLDELDRAAHLDRQAINESRTARQRLAKLVATLRARAADLQQLTAAEERTTSSLEAARAERVRYIARLRDEQRLKAAQIARLAATARAGASRSEAIEAAHGSPASVAAVATPPAATPAAPIGNSITVTATGYSLAGTTSTGLPAGWGIVAVDPGVIPLGTHLTIPGYGDGVAADTGGAVHGAVIDLWFPTQAQALAWGRRVVTITVH